MEPLKKHGLTLLFGGSLSIALLIWVFSGSLRGWVNEQLGTVTECTAGALDTKITEEFNYVCDIQPSAQVSEVVLAVFLLSLLFAALSAAGLLTKAINKKWRR